MKTITIKLCLFICLACAAALVGGCATLQAAQASTTQVDFTYIKEHATTVKLLDVRPFEDYAGELKNDADRKGHIPGATSLPYQNMLNKEGQPIEEVRLARMFSHAKLESGDEIIVYGSGNSDVEETVALLEQCGYTNAKACMMSYDEWAADETNEVEKSSLSCCVE